MVSLIEKIGTFTPLLRSWRPQKICRKNCFTSLSFIEAVLIMELIFSIQGAVKYCSSLSDQAYFKY